MAAERVRTGFPGRQNESANNAPSKHKNKPKTTHRQKAKAHSEKKRNASQNGALTHRRNEKARTTPLTTTPRPRFGDRRNAQFSFPISITNKTVKKIQHRRK